MNIDCSIDIGESDKIGKIIPKKKKKKRELYNIK
jgi:hypothetical protein